MCPVRTSNNNKVLSSNARNSDVASRAIQEILPAQQMRYYSAFRVQGFEGVLYNRVKQGLKCTCGASERHLASRLDEDGKAKPGVINELLTGVSVFNVTPYGQSMPRDNPFDSVVSPQAPVNKHQGVFDIVQAEPQSLPANVTDGFGDNGPLSAEFDIDTLVGEFDASHAGYSEVSCPICFGTNFVGGYAPLYGCRIVKPVNEVVIPAEGVIDLTRKPWRCKSRAFEFYTVLPFGAQCLDIFRVCNDKKVVPANFTIDGQPINPTTVLRFCDGRLHLVKAEFQDNTDWTHIEIQFGTSAEAAFFEFPRLSKSSDISLLDQTEPFQIILSPLIPLVEVQDIFTDTGTGKALIVETVNSWNTRNKDVLGWECQVRPIQQPELYNLLPRRRRTLTKTQTSNIAHDNSTGYRRT